VPELRATHEAEGSAFERFAVHAIHLSVGVQLRQRGQATLSVRNLFGDLVYRHTPTSARVFVLNQRQGLENLLTPFAYKLFPLRVSGIIDGTPRRASSPAVPREQVVLENCSPCEDALLDQPIVQNAFCMNNGANFFFPCCVDNGILLAPVDKDIQDAADELNLPDPLPERPRKQSKNKNVTMLVQQAQQFIKMCQDNRSAFVFAPRGPKGCTADNPGCDLVFVSSESKGPRDVFLIELKDQRVTSAVQWNQKIKKLAAAPMLRVLQRFRFSFVLAGRSDSEFNRGPPRPKKPEGRGGK